MNAPDIAGAQWRKSSHSTNASNCVEVAFTHATWRKSSHSSNASNCVEVAFADAAWRKSSRSSTQSNCVEVAVTEPVVAVRDSKNTTGPVLAFAPTAWSAFLRLPH